MRVSITNFKGIRPKVAPDLLAGNEAQVADNCKLSSGQLRSWYNELVKTMLENTGIIRTIHLYEDQYWLEWEADVDIVPAPVSGDTKAKIYYTGHGIPKKTDRDQAITGSGAMPINFYPLAVPTAKYKPLTSVGSGGSGDDRSITYCWTVVTTWSEEGLPSPASDVVTSKNGQTVNLRNMTLQWQPGQQYSIGDFVIVSAGRLIQEDGVSGLLLEDGISYIHKEYDESSQNLTYIYKCVVAGTSGTAQPIWGTEVDGDTVDGTVTWRCFKNNLKEKRIYRLNTGNAYAQYEYVSAISISETTLEDNVTDSNLAENLPSAIWDPPLDELRGLTYMSNGILVAFTGKDLYFSEPYRPWAWPRAYSLSLESPIVSVGSIGTTIVVTTEKRPYVISGVDPSSMIPTKLPDPKACVSKRSTDAYSFGVIYAAADGLYMIDGARGKLITEDHYTVDEWKLLHPETMHGHIHDSKYFCFYSSGGDEGGLVLDLITGDITTLGFYSHAAFVDLKTDTLYFLKQEADALLLENGINYPTRDYALLLEDNLYNLSLE